MYSGQLHLDFDDGNVEHHLVATISRCILSDDKLVLEFHGRNEGDDFSGNFSLLKTGNFCHGSALWIAACGNRYPATVSLKLEVDGKSARYLTLSGTWLDEGESSPYQLEADLEKAEPA